MSTAPGAAAFAARPALQPMGMAHLTLRTYGILLRHVVQLAGMAIAVAVPPLALYTLGEWLNSEVLEALSFLTAYASVLYFFAAVTLLVSDDIRGVRTSYVQIARRLRGLLLFRYIGVALLQLVLVVLAALPGLLAIALMGATSTMQDAGSILLVLAFMVIAAVPAAYVTVALLFAQPAVVVEQLGVRRAIRRSWKLTTGERWRTMRRFAAFLLLVWVPCFVVLAVVVFALVPELDPTLAGVLFEVVCLPPVMVFPVLVYYDLRTRKEHLNVQGLLQDQ